MKLIMHIGTEKTGTTTIQSFLKANSKLLSNKSIFIPPAVLFGDNRAYSIPFQKRVNMEALNWFQSKDREDLAQKKVAVVSHLQNIFRRAREKYGWCIISSEHFSSRLTDKSEIKNALDFYSQFFSEIEVIIYIRNQYFFAVSTYSETIKWGGFISFQDHLGQINENNPFWNSRLLIENWRQVLGETKVKVLKYKEDAEFDVINDFLKSANIETKNMKFSYPANSNKSLKYLGVCLMRLWNKEHNRNPKKTYWATLNYLKQKLITCDEGDLARVYFDHCEEIKQFSKGINDTLIKDFNIDLNPEFDLITKKLEIARLKIIKQKADRIFKNLINLEDSFFNE
jgi:hypothetical protein